MLLEHSDGSDEKTNDTYKRPFKWFHKMWPDLKQIVFYLIFHLFPFVL